MTRSLLLQIVTVQFQFGVFLVLLIIMAMAMGTDTFTVTLESTRNIELDEELCSPQHVHVAYGDFLSQVVILWATKGSCSTMLEFGTSEWKLNSRATGRQVEFLEQNLLGLHFIHRVKLENLTASTTYFYRPLSNDIGRGPFYFRTPQTDQDWSPKFLVFGDLGIHTQTIPTLVEEALTGEYTALLHVGDFAYNLFDENGLVGDRFMQNIEPVAAYLPYMTSPGNHEQDSETFTHYGHRFSMPGTPWPMNVNKLWYSFNIGSVHFISYSSEVFFTQNGRLIEAQSKWLVEDLRKANSLRDQQPWVIAFGHRPMYCSANDGDDCAKEKSLVREGLEDIFCDGGVDIVIQAHEHNYERLYQMYKGLVVSTNYTDPQVPIQIISGAAGSKHGVDHFLPPPKPSWSAVRVENKSLNSYGLLHVINATHVYWEQRSIHNHAVLDTLWIVQHHHGSFHLPKNVSQKLNMDFVTDVASAILEDSDDMAEELKKQDSYRRIAIGTSFGVLVLIVFVAAVLLKVCRQTQYSSVRRWDPADLDYGEKLFSSEKADDRDLADDFEIDMATVNLQTKKLLNNN